MSKPRAIITKLEDCPPLLDRKLVKAYWESDYLLQSLDLPDEQTLLFRFDLVSANLLEQLKCFDIQSFAIVSAFNPGSVTLLRKRNMELHELLRVELKPHCRMLRNAVNQASNGSWQELAYWALDIDPEIAVRTGQLFGQNALVYWEQGRQAALWWL